MLYLGLELLTLSSYAMVALRRDHEASVEAAMKYFVLGAMASGFLLYGMSMIYGATGTLDIGEIFKVIDAGETKHANPGVWPGVLGGGPGLQAGGRTLSTCGFPTCTTVRPLRSP